MKSLVRITLKANSLGIRAVHAIDWWNSSIIHTIWWDMNFGTITCFHVMLQIFVIVDTAQNKHNKDILPLSLVRWKRWKTSCFIDFPFHRRRGRRINKAGKDFRRLPILCGSCSISGIYVHDILYIKCIFLIFV